MSTTKRAKLARQRKHELEKKEREYRKMFAPKHKTEEFVEYKPKEVYRRSTPDYPSLMTTGTSDTSKPERKEYTGTLIRGIATMHKSNAVPVISKEEAEDISKMRRN